MYNDMLGAEKVRNVLVKPTWIVYVAQSKDKYGHNSMFNKCSPFENSNINYTRVFNVHHLFKQNVK